MILSARDISLKLASAAEPFARWIFPKGVKEGVNWVVGSLDGGEGKSLKVCISGSKAGVWADFAGDDRGDLLTLIASVRKVRLAEAIRIAKEWLGIRDPENIVPKRNYSKPSAQKIQQMDYSGKAFKYLTAERGLDDETIRQFKLYASNNGEAIAFPSYSPDGNLENVSHIFLARENGKKKVLQEKGCAPSLFGWQAFPEGEREIIITEGQIDAMTWAQCGYTAMSVPNGSENHDWIDYEWDKLQQFDTINLSFDDDASGKKAVKEVASRLGLHRCLIVRITGYKDANECLQKTGDITPFMEAMRNAKPISPEAIRAPIEFRDKVQEKFFPKDGIKPGFWPVLFNYELGLRPGELTIWTGVAGHGKSVLLTQISLEAIHNGLKTSIASMEMRGESTLHRMLSQSEMMNQVKPDDIDTMLNWLAGKLWIYDLLGNVSPKLILDLMDYSYARHGVTNFVIDSLMKCSVGSDDYDGQRVFINELCSFAKSHESHIHLVAHARKGKDESEKPGKLDVRGSSDIINQADNILTVWRNKDKEQKAYAKTLNEDDAVLMPDTIVYCNKQRESGDEFKKSYKYYKAVFRFNTLGAREIQDLSIMKAVRANGPNGSVETNGEIENEPATDQSNPD